MNKRILRLAIPNIISNLSVPLLSSVDTALMGRQDGAEYIGAVALGALVFNFVYWSFAFLRMGTTGLIAQAFGKKENALIANILGRALVLAAVSGAAILLLQVPLERFSFYLLGASDRVETLAKSYFYMRVWAAPATLCLYVFMGWFFGMQNAVYPLILTAIINIVNIVCNFYFVNVLNMTADGVALGTVIAQYTGLVVAIGLFLYKYRYLIPHFQRKAIMEWQSFKAFMALNSDIFIRTFCLVFAFAFFDNQSAILGDLPLAVNGVLLQFTFWVSYGIDGLGFAAESLVGRYFGEKKRTTTTSSVALFLLLGNGSSSYLQPAFLDVGRCLIIYFYRPNEHHSRRQAFPYMDGTLSDSEYAWLHLGWRFCRNDAF